MAQRIRLDLSKFKASGVYTLEFDQSESILLTPQTIRLVVGFSKKGPFNSPVFLPDIKTARRIFGDIDLSLERKGSFFHRSLFTCLQNGPVFALNLLKLNDDDTTLPDLSDKINYVSFSVDTDVNEENLVKDIGGNNLTALFSSFYNKERFWFPDASYMLATVQSGINNIDKRLFHFTNLSKSPVTIIVKKSNVRGYDLTAKEWYADGIQERPSFLRDDDFISDFFLDVIAVEGDWTDYASLSVDPIYSAFFNARGLRKDRIEQFLSFSDVSLVARLTGAIIPNFQDKNGTNQYLQVIVNNTVATTGLFMTINEQALDDPENAASVVDLVGHHLINATGGNDEINMISYHARLNDNKEFADDVSNPYLVVGSPWDVLVAVDGTELYEAWASGVIENGSYIIIDSTGTKQYLQFLPGSNIGGSFVEIRAFDTPNFTSQESVSFGPGNTFVQSGSTFVPSTQDVNIVTDYGNYRETVQDLTLTLGASVQSNQFIVSSIDAEKVRVGSLVVNKDGDRLTRVVRAATFDILGNVLVTCSAPVDKTNGEIRVFKSIEDFVQEYQTFHLTGFQLLERHMPNGSNARMNQILDVLYDTNLAVTLKSKDAIDFRYIVDTFNHGLEPNSKSRLTRLAKMRQKALALLNTPSINEFINSTDPRFTDAPTAANPKPLLNTRYIATGGNLFLNPSFTYSLVDEELGSKYCGYFSPNLVLREGGRNISIPPAAHVSNLFINKFINGTPFAIVAGTRRGLISDPNLVGVDYEFSDEDREELEPFGINPLIRKRGQGVLIYANQSGFQRVNSAFNNLHVRDILITIETDIEAILEGYLFEFNDPATRLEIQSKVDNYLEGVQSAGGIFDFVTIMDTSNNTPEIIDQNIGIIDVIIEPSRGIQKFINRVTVVRTGAVASGGFTVA
jgi:hypothetical protein